MQDFVKVETELTIGKARIQCLVTAEIERTPFGAQLLEVYACTFWDARSRRHCMLDYMNDNTLRNVQQQLAYV